MLQLFRGAGVQGLAAMPALSTFGFGQHVRPLLAETRERLALYAKENQLNYIDDPSNQDTAFDRNFLRNKIIPSLKARWPSINKTISRSAMIQAETKQLLEEVAEKDLNSVCSEQNNTLSLSKLSKLSLLRQKLLIRHWISVSGFSAPSEKKLKHIFNDVINAVEDAQPLVEWRGVQIRRYQSQLYIMRSLIEHDVKQIIEWNTQESITIESLKITLAALNLDEKEPVTIRFRQGGESIYLPERGGHHSIKHILQEAKIPPWLRSRIPLIYKGEKIIKVLF